MISGRKKSLFPVIFTLVILLLPGYWLSAQTEPSTPADVTPTPPVVDDSTDITDQIREYNSDKYAKPLSDFRQGHVTPRQLDEKAISKIEGRVEVQLPSRAPIATPAVDGGIVFVSGGFHSKEYYAFEAGTGKLQWAVNLDDDGPSSAVAREGVVIFNTESCTIFALDTRTGAHLWSWWLGDPLMSTPTIANSRVFTAYPASGRYDGSSVQQIQEQNVNQLPPPETMPETKEEQKAVIETKGKAPLAAPPASHVLAAFDLRTGKILWQRWLDSDVLSAPIAEGDELFVTTFSGTMYRFRQSDGEILSVRQVRATSAPVVVQGEVYYSKRADAAGAEVAEESIVTARKEKGTEIRAVNRKTAGYIDGRVQANSEYKTKGSSLDAGNGFAGGAPAQANSQAAFDNIGQANVSTLQAYQGSRVLSYRDNNYNVMGDEIICNDRQTGEKRWSRKLTGDLETAGGFLGTPPATAGGFIFVGTLNGEVLQLDPADGKAVKSFKVGSAIRSQPVVEGGFIYVGTEDGKLVILDTKDEKLTGWPMWGGDAAHTGYRETNEKK